MITFRFLPSTSLTRIVTVDSTDFHKNNTNDTPKEVEIVVRNSGHETVFSTHTNKFLIENNNVNLITNTTSIQNCQILAV